MVYCLYLEIAVQHEAENVMTCVWTNRKSLKTRVERSCFEKVCRSCFTSGTLKKSMISHERGQNYGIKTTTNSPLKARETSVLFNVNIDVFSVTFLGCYLICCDKISCCEKCDRINYTLL